MAVVGGGAIGLAVAAELAREGVGRVVLLEREPAVGQGSTARANGGVRAQFTTPVNIAFSLYSIAEFERLRPEHEDLLSWHQVGYLFFTGTDHGEAHLRGARELQRSLGVDTAWVEPVEIGRLAPLVRLSGLRGGTFHPRDGFLDPHGTVQALRRECPPDRVTIRTATEVVGLRPQREGSIMVETSSGELEAGSVINAAGPHARQVAGLLGVDIPVEPVRRNLAFARIPGEPPGLIPMCIDVDRSAVLLSHDLEDNSWPFSCPSQRGDPSTASSDRRGSSPSGRTGRSSIGGCRPSPAAGTWSTSGAAEANLSLRSRTL